MCFTLEDVQGKEERKESSTNKLSVEVYSWLFGDLAENSMNIVIKCPESFFVA